MEVNQAFVEWLLMFLVGLASLILQFRATTKQKPRKKPSKRKGSKPKAKKSKSKPKRRG